MRFALLALLFGCASGGDATPPIREGAPKLRVMTYNVNFGLVGNQEGVQAIAGGSPDIVLLQETNKEWERAIVGTLGKQFPHHRFAEPKNEWIAGGMGLLSKYPIKSIDQLDSDAGPFFAWRIVIDAPGGPIQFINFHLHPPMDTESGSWVIGYFSTRSVREREARDHIAKIDFSMPTIVAGDFNEEDEGKAIALFRERGFANALPRFRPDADTWHWTVGGGATLRFRLDHVLYEESKFTAVGADVLDKGHSDHFPVYADLVRR